MDVIVILLPLSVSIAAVFLVMFVRAVRSGQYDDLDDAARRVLDDERSPSARRPTREPRK
jgi:cbb3-type cytochrome oxidase maturation protein